jgi:HEPN domain-containing protein
MDRHLDWLRQSENDLAWAKHSLEGGFYSQTCFVAQQASEKALKAFCFNRGYDVVRTHSLYQIVKTLGENGILEKHARELDLYYISARYPDAFPAGAPFEIITADQAGRALEAAREIFTIVRNRLPDEAETS